MLSCLSGNLVNTTILNTLNSKRYIKHMHWKLPIAIKSPNTVNIRIRYWFILYRWNAGGTKVCWCLIGMMQKCRANGHYWFYCLVSHYSGRLYFSITIGASLSPIVVIVENSIKCIPFSSFTSELKTNDEKSRNKTYDWFYYLALHGNGLKCMYCLGWQQTCFEIVLEVICQTHWMKVTSRDIV